MLTIASTRCTGINNWTTLVIVTINHMNCKEHHLPELELPTCHVREALQCILHTILFIRSPGPVEPKDVTCEGFGGLTYSRIAVLRARAPSFSSSSNTSSSALQKSVLPQSDLDERVDQAMDSFLRSLSQIGPELLSGCLTLSFLERRTSRQLFGFISNEEKIIFEQWHLRVVVNNTPRPLENDSASILERQRLQDMSEGMLRAALMRIIDLSNNPDLDHIPPVDFDFEIRCSKKQDDRENMYSRVTNMPPLFALDG